jgi:hypothetical protein
MISPSVWRILSAEAQIVQQRVNLTKSSASAWTIGGPCSAEHKASPSTSACSQCYTSYHFAGGIQRCGTTCSTTSSCGPITTDSDGYTTTISTTAITPWTVYPAQMPVAPPTIPLDECGHPVFHMRPSMASMASSVQRLTASIPAWHGMLITPLRSYPFHLLPRKPLN